MNKIYVIKIQKDQNTGTKISTALICVTAKKLEITQISNNSRTDK